MTELFQWVLSILKEFRVFVVVLPWESVIRCRMGNRVQTWGSGWHIRIPFVDTLTVVNTRLRVSIAPTQTLTTLDGESLSVAMSVGFCIVDARAALMRFADPEQSVGALAQSAVASFITPRMLSNIQLAVLEEHVATALQETAQGSVQIEFVRVLDFVNAPTVRLLQESWRATPSNTDRTL